MVFNVGEIAPPGGDFIRCGGDIVIYEIWEAISVSRGAILQVKPTQRLNWFQKEQYWLLWNQGIWCILGS